MDLLDDEETRDALVSLVVRGMARGEITPPLQSLVDSGLAAAKGPIVMPAGAATHEVRTLLRVTPNSEIEERVTRLYHAFLPVNRRLRDLCTAWQCRPDGSTNDHTDAAYDAEVRDQLDDVHEAIVRILRRLGAAIPRLGGYQERLERALERVDNGESGVVRLAADRLLPHGLDARAPGVAACPGG